MTTMTSTTIAALALLTIVSPVQAQYYYDDNRNNHSTRNRVIAGIVVGTYKFVSRIPEPKVNDH